MLPVVFFRVYNRSPFKQFFNRYALHPYPRDFYDPNTDRIHTKVVRASYHRDFYDPNTDRIHT
jgi:hypothetical protein